MVHNSNITADAEHCKGMLFQMEDNEWEAAVNKYDANNPGYKAYLDWLKGKCFKLDKDAKKAYEDEQKTI